MFSEAFDVNIEEKVFLSHCLFLKSQKYPAGRRPPQTTLDFGGFQNSLLYLNKLSLGHLKTPLNFEKITELVELNMTCNDMKLLCQPEWSHNEDKK